MKTIWCYDEPGDDGENVHIEMDEDQIIEQYWEYFKDRMDERFGPNYYLTTKKSCIEDWTVIHWAYKKN